ncbi:pseudouridine synthase [Lutibacter sp. TH_r2]|uniref:pseudouridine synthase n=1 Tax=Lutibacter sp. TH_r2 TaxID=3082083 RepID=UPI002952DF00|nr:pseudouridine synthase [Lutibacter sp. TH_r2]MDV7187193.1 pseudouridine synthase [Lutibacter sp. TH_r2]
MEKPKHQHFAIFKPYGYLSQFVNNQTKRSNKKLLGELFNFPKNAMAIGRLDEPSEGLLLITTNGKVSEAVRSSKFEKEYYAQVDGIISNEAIELLKNGVEINTETGKYLTKKSEVFKLTETPKLPERAKKIRDERHGPTSWISITLTEGKFRQVRKMTATVGFPTLRLVRVRIGEISINKMQAGEVIEFNNLIE